MAPPSLPPPATRGRTQLDFIETIDVELSIDVDRTLEVNIKLRRLDVTRNVLEELVGEDDRTASDEDYRQKQLM